MTDEPSRFRVIEGGGEPEQKPRPRRLKNTRTGKTSKVEKYQCAQCSEEIGHAYSALVKLRIGTVEQDGKLKGGETWWCCHRCERPKFLVRKHY